MNGNDLTTFSDLGLAESLLRAVAAEGYETPTAIQVAAIPHGLAGDDLLGIAQTGTGKTAAFVLPMLQCLAAEATKPQPKSCRALILAPTRELAAQILDCIRAYGKFMKLTATLVVGGVKPGPQIVALARGVDILVATPGRLLDHMSTGAVRIDAVRTVVLDEADQMLDLGFMPAIRRIMAKTPKARQTQLFSATMPPAIRALANDFLKSPKEVQATPVSRPIERITQRVIATSAEEKRAVLTEILKTEAKGRTIVFTRTKHGADRVTKHLNAAGLSAVAIHGNKSQNQRTRALDGFKSAEIRILVATDIAARGIDVDGIEHVVNFELPNVPEVYVHRIGRTARAGADGIAITLCDPMERKLLRDIERLIGRTLLQDGHAPGVESPRPAQQKPDGRNKPAAARNRRRKPSSPRRMSDAA
jgi:ATP-dependent RNA helicase RhlE